MRSLSSSPQNRIFNHHVPSLTGKSPIRFGAMDLERVLMREIGLGSTPHYFNGSHASKGVRIAAAEQLPAVIQRHVDAGDPIVPPNPMLMALLKEIAKSADQEDYLLTKTWEAAASIIARHIHVYSAPHRAQEQFEQLRQSLKKRYLGRETPPPDPASIPPLNLTDAHSPHLGPYGRGGMSGGAKSSFLRIVYVVLEFLGISPRHKP